MLDDFRWTDPWLKRTIIRNSFDPTILGQRVEACSYPETILENVEFFIQLLLLQTVVLQFI